MSETTIQDVNEAWAAVRVDRGKVERANVRLNESEIIYLAILDQYRGSE